jgi:hypothetical protein
MGKEDDISGLVAKRGFTSALSTSGARNTAAGRGPQDILDVGTTSSRQTHPNLPRPEPFCPSTFSPIILHFAGLIQLQTPSSDMQVSRKSSEDDTVLC